MNNPVTFFLLMVSLIIIAVYLNYLVWFRYTTLVNWLVNAFSLMRKLNLPLTVHAISYVKSPVYKWLVRFIALSVLLIALFPVIIMLIKM